MVQVEGIDVTETARSAPFAGSTNNLRTLTDDQRAALNALHRQAETPFALGRKLDALRLAIDGLEKLGGLLPYCSTGALNITIPADPAAMATVGDGVTELLNSKGWPETEVMKVELALQEGLANAVRHGCKNDLTKKVQCSVTFDAVGEVVIVIRDPGPGCDVSAVPNPLEGTNLLKPSGREVFLINELMDTVEFSDEGRRVMMRKRIDAGP